MKKIIIKYDLEMEVDIFQKFLHNDQFPQHRNMILSCFPVLKDELETDSTDERSTIRRFIAKVREDKIADIDKSIAYIQNEIERHGETALEMLAKMMDYTWRSDSPNYILLPTILPISPFGENIFYFSINKSLAGIVEFPKVLAVAVHEVSHMLFFEIIEQMDVKMGRELIYFVKELVAPVLVFQDDFNGIFKKEIIGNYNVLEIYFNHENRVVRAFDFFNELYVENRSSGGSFVQFLDRMIKICEKIEPDIKDKLGFDNKFGVKIMKDPELLNKYREPIFI